MRISVEGRIQRGRGRRFAVGIFREESDFPGGRLQRINIADPYYLQLHGHAFMSAVQHNIRPYNISH